MEKLAINAAALYLALGIAIAKPVEQLENNRYPLITEPTQPAHHRPDTSAANQRQFLGRTRSCRADERRSTATAGRGGDDNIDITRLQLPRG